MKFHNCYTIMAGQDSCRFTTALPSSASRWISTWISTLAPTLEAARRFIENDQIGILRQRLAITTFCWLPPDSSATFMSLPAARTLSGRIPDITRSTRMIQNGRSLDRFQSGGPPLTGAP
jgi:hypothetical protein